MLRDVEGGGSLRLPLAAATAGVFGLATEAAWGEFQLRLRAFVSRRVKHRADAEDIVQNVFLEMHRSLPALRSPDRLGAWLYRTARNAVVDHYRTPARRREVASGDTRELEMSHLPVASMDEDVVTDEAFVVDCLTPLVRRLPDAYQRAIELVELRGVTQRAAAEIEGLSLSGMKTRVQRARRHLKASLLRCCRIALDARGRVLSCDTPAPANPPCAWRAADGRREDR
jgi:RNA polymerase sigma-70 factor (ECF subfamily)